MLWKHFHFFKIQETRELEKSNQQKSQSPMIHTVSGSPKFGRLKYSQQESKPSTPVKADLTNGEPEKKENGDDKPQDDSTSAVLGK